MGSYEIGPFEKGDMEDYLQLRTEVFGSWDDSKSKEQFKWKYIENPFLDHIPIFVAKANGRIVGARGVIAQPMKVNGDRILSIQGSDAMVHSNHRRKGVYSKIYEAMLSEYESRNAKILTGFSNSKSRPIHLQFGCEDLELIKYQRLSSAVSPPDSVTDVGTVKNTLLKTGYSAGLSILDALKSLSGGSIPNDIQIKRYDDHPIDVLVNLSDKPRADGIQYIRDPTYYHWRLNEPMVDFSTYVLFDQSGKPVSAIIISERSEKILIREMLSLEETGPSEPLLDLLTYVLEQKGRKHRYVVLTAKTTRELFRYGFLPPDAPFQSPQSFVVKSLDPDAGTVINGIDITKRENWNISYLDRDH